MKPEPQPDIEIKRLQCWYAAAQRNPALGHFVRDLRRFNAGASALDCWDDGMYRLWGLPMTDPVPSSAEMLRRMSVSDQQRVLDDMGQGRAVGDTGGARFRIEAHDGVKRWVQSNWVVMDAGNGSLVACGSLHDVSDVMQETNGSLALDSEILWAADAAGIGLIRENLATGRCMGNSAARDMLGMSGCESWLHEQTLIGVDTGSAGALARARQAALAGESDGGEVQFRRVVPGARARQFREYCKVLRNPAGQAIELISVLIEITSQIEAVECEQALVQSRELAISLAGLGCWEYSIEHGSFALDERQLRSYGLDGKRARMSLGEWFSAIHPSDSQRMTERWTRFERGQANLDGEAFRVRLPCGAVRWLQISGGIEHQALGGAAVARGITWDVTQRESLLNQLRVEREAQSISERLAHVGTFRRSFIDGSAYWSSELNRITGRELSAEAPGWDDRLTRFTVPSQLKLERAFEQAKIDGLGYDVEVDFFRDDGRVGRAILASEFARDASGQLTSQVGCFVDITALHETRLESESARERLQALFDRTLNGILLLDDHGRFVEANPAVCAMFGHSREAILRLSMAEFLVGDVERTPSEATLFHFLRSLGDRGLLQLRSASGTDRVAEISVAQDVQPGLHLCILSDVTARVHAERALAAAEASLSQLAARQRDEFDALRAELARDVHDVLGQSLSALMLELGALGPELGEHAARLKLLLRQAIDTTRDLSRALRPAALDLGLAAALRALAEEVSMRTDVDISTDIPATVPCLPEASTRGIYRVVQEALSNVVRHSGARKASVTVKIAVGKLTVSVRDDGCGFDGDVLTRGLGVVGMKERARQIGAQFSVCGAMGCGVTVQVVLPVP